MIGGLGLPEILVLLVIFLVLFGAKKLPQIGEGLGKTVKEFRKIRDERKADKRNKEEEKKWNPVPDLKKEMKDIPGVKEALEVKETIAKVREVTKISKLLK